MYCGGGGVTPTVWADVVAESSGLGDSVEFLLRRPSLRSCSYLLCLAGVMDGVVVVDGVLVSADEISGVAADSSLEDVDLGCGNDKPNLPIVEALRTLFCWTNEVNWRRYLIQESLYLSFLFFLFYFIINFFGFR